MEAQNRDVSLVWVSILWTLYVFNMETHTMEATILKLQYGICSMNHWEGEVWLCWACWGAMIGLVIRHAHLTQFLYFISSQPTEVKNVPLTMRTNLKQHLMKQKFQEEQKQREQQRQVAPAYHIPPGVTQQESTKAVQISGSSLPSEVPPAIFKVLWQYIVYQWYIIELMQLQALSNLVVSCVVIWVLTYNVVCWCWITFPLILSMLLAEIHVF